MIEPLAAEALIATSPCIGEFDRVADEVEQDLGELAFVAVARSAGWVRSSTLSAMCFSLASDSTAL